jgi:hypothetical protein
MVLGIWICAIFQEKPNKVKVGRIARVTCSVQGRVTYWTGGSIGVGAVFDKLAA